MPNHLPAGDQLQREYLQIRARILDIASALDRIETAAGDVTGDPRVQQIGRALGELGAAGGDRAERVQMIFSRDYDPAWRQES